MASPDGASAGQKKKKMNTFHPTLWGEFFLTYQSPSSAQQAQMQERAGVLREEVRLMVTNANGVPNILDLIATVQRLGLDYHYKNEINHLLDVVLNSDYDDNNLNLVSLRFYLLRKNGYDVSSDVFLKFQDKEGNFVKAEAASLLSLYNAACLRTRGDKVLNEAISFTRGCLLGAVKHMESQFAKEVSSVLETPLFRRAGLLETRNYISNYQKETTRNEALLELAKLNFNLLQVLLCDELMELTMWWKELSVKSKLSFVRDRIVEIYFCMTGVFCEPQYSHSRVILTKITCYITIIDDTFDTYGTTEESMQLAEAISRWDESASALLPQYLKDFYLHMLRTFCSFENELGPERRYRVFVLKEMMKRLVQAYSEEIKWRDEHYVPKTMREHLNVSMISIGALPLVCASLVGMDETIPTRTFSWFLGDPKTVHSLGIFMRLVNDIVSSKREQAAEHSCSTIQCYMAEHNTTMHDASQKIKELVEDSWKDMLRNYLERTDEPMVVPPIVLNFARAATCMYKKNDGFTFSDTVKDKIRLLVLEPIE